MVRLRKIVRTYPIRSRVWFVVSRDDLLFCARTAANSLPVTETPSEDAAEDDSDEDEVYFGTLTLKENEKRVESIKAQTLAPHLALLPADLVGQVANCSSEVHANRQKASAAAFRETLQSAVRTATKPVASSVGTQLLVDLGTADLGSHAKDEEEDDEEEVFFGKISTHEVTKTLAQHRKEKEVSATSHNEDAGAQNVIPSASSEPQVLDPPATKLIDLGTPPMTSSSSVPETTQAAPLPLEQLLDFGGTSVFPKQGPIGQDTETSSLIDLRTEDSSISKTTNPDSQPTKPIQGKSVKSSIPSRLAQPAKVSTRNESVSRSIFSD